MSCSNKLLGLVPEGLLSKVEVQLGILQASCRKQVLLLQAAVQLEGCAQGAAVLGE